VLEEAPAAKAGDLLALDGPGREEHEARVAASARHGGDLARLAAWDHELVEERAGRDVSLFALELGLATMAVVAWDPERRRAQLQFLYVLGCYARRHGGILIERREWKDQKGRGRTMYISMRIDLDLFKRVDAEVRESRGWR